jgi:hypothetical protein
VIPRESAQTSNTETDLTKESLRKVAEKVGISEPTLSKALKVVEKGTPEVQKAVEKGELSVKRAYELWRDWFEAESDVNYHALTHGVFRPLEPR